MAKPKLKKPAEVEYIIGDEYDGEVVDFHAFYDHYCGGIPRFNPMSDAEFLAKWKLVVDRLTAGRDDAEASDLRERMQRLLNWNAEYARQFGEMMALSHALYDRLEAAGEI